MKGKMWTQKKRKSDVKRNANDSGKGKHGLNRGSTLKKEKNNCKNVANV